MMKNILASVMNTIGVGFILYLSDKEHFLKRPLPYILGILAYGVIFYIVFTLRTRKKDRRNS